MGRTCPRVELYRLNWLAAEVAFTCTPVLLGGSEFMARMMLDHVVLAGLTQREKDVLLRRVTRSLFSKPVSEALRAKYKENLEKARERT